MITPKFKRNIVRIIPFGIIWLLLGWVFLINDITVTGNQNLNPETQIEITLPIFIFASVAIMIAGLIFGAIELLVLEKKFKHYRFGSKVIYKFLIYLAFILSLLTLLYPMASSIEMGLSFFNQRVWNKTIQFYQSTTMLNTVFQLSFHIAISLIYAAISENLGYNVLVNLFTGKYHKPVEERRVFMFLDMKNSTTIAEKLGHKTYFKLLEEYYEVMSDPIINTYGDVYQYIGDEVVITWPKDKGIKNNNCLHCFHQIKHAIKENELKFVQKFKVAPDFKAGMHIGNVTTGEIGALKKEVVYTGDVLNTTARIQGMCKNNHTDLIISEDLINLLSCNKREFHSVGPVTLKGKNSKVELYALK